MNSLVYLDIFLTFGVLPMVGTSFVAIGELEPNVALLCVPVGFITVGILHANNMRDTVQDRRANIKTVAMNLGGKTSAVLYGVEVLLPFGAVVAGVVAGLFPVTALFVLVAVKMAWSNFSMALKYPEQGMEAVKGLDERTAQLQLAFSVLLSISLVIAGFLKDNPMW